MTSNFDKRQLVTVLRSSHMFLNKMISGFKLLKHAIRRTSAYTYLISVKSWLSDTRGQLSVFHDFHVTRRHLRFLRHSIRDVPKRSDLIDVLVLNISNNIYTTKLEAMLAAGLALEGHNIAVLVTRSSPWAKPYFRSFGLNRFLYLEDFSISTVQLERCDVDAKELLRGDLTFAKVKAWTYQGAWIGPQILAGISRRNHLGAPDLTDPGIKAEVTNLLPQVLANVVQAKKIIENVRPKLAIVNEANGPDMGPLVDMSIRSGIDVIQYNQPSRDDSLILKRLNADTRRIHPASVSKTSFIAARDSGWTSEKESALWEEIENRYNGRWFLQSRNQPKLDNTDFDPSSIRNKLKLDPNKKTAVLFSHILWDANLFYGEDLFEDYGEWFVESVKAACKNSNVNWLIKLHPANVWKRARENVHGELAEIELIKSKIGALPAHVRLIYPDSEISSRTLFRICDYGITVRGTVGIELPCLGVTTFTAGTGRYSGMGFTVDSKSREEYLQKLAEIQTFPPASERIVQLAKLHAYTLFRMRPWKMKSFQSEFNYRTVGSHALDHNLIPVAKTISELKENQDLFRWASWAKSLNQVDYLDEGP